MAKNQYIAWILLLLVAVTVFNLFYKPWLTVSYSPFQSPLPGQLALIHPVQTSLCPLQGFKCPSDEACDCSQLCSSDEAYIPYRVLPNEHIYVLDRLLPPGTYCLPKGAGMCHQESSNPIFSLTGWSCVPRNKSIFHEEKVMACKHEESLNNDLNQLWDYKENKGAVHVKDYYETLDEQGTLRYRCRCEGTDGAGKPLVNIVPFMCVTDYCVQDIKNPLPGMGWNGSGCDCGVYFHEDPQDVASPCVMERTRVENGKLIVRVECMNNDAWIKRAMYCPKEEGVLSFTVPFVVSGASADFLAKHKDFQP